MATYLKCGDLAYLLEPQQKGQVRWYWRNRTHLTEDFVAWSPVTGLWFWFIDEAFDLGDVPWLLV